MGTETKTYLGDSVYAVVEGGVLVLTTENGLTGSNRIVLEPEVWGALLKFLAKPEPEPLPRAETHPDEEEPK